MALVAGGACSHSSEKCLGSTGGYVITSIRMGTNMADGNHATETSVTEFFYKSLNLFFEELINIKVILFLIHELFR